VLVTLTREKGGITSNDEYSYSDAIPSL
jgi:hypothetical protein